MAGLKKTNKKVLSCLTCKLREGDVLTPKMEPYGLGEKGVLIIGEAPSKADDHKGQHWQGRNGRKLKDVLSRVGIDLYRDCISVAAVNCRPPNNRTPKPFEIDCCREVVMNKLISEFDPHVIVLLGTVSLQSFLGPRWPSDLGGIAKWRGFVIPDQDFQSWVVPTYHPTYLLHMSSREVETVWKQDFERVAEVLEQDVPIEPEPEIHILKDLKYLERFNNCSELAFDYETTGLKSQGKGHRIVCASVAVDETTAFAFMMPETKAEMRPFVDLLTNPRVGKMAHNMKFETAWTRNKLRQEVRDWQWDSMIAAHILDNRTGVTGLKFQTYVNFGVIDYSSEITPYLRGRDKSGNSFNKIYELLEQPGGQEKLLTYCALDSYYEFRLAKIQMKELGYNFLPF